MARILMILRIATLFLAALSLPAVAGDSPKMRRLQKTIENPGCTVLVAAHRGGYANDKEDKAPENSVANVEAAIRKGFDVYETDIRRTEDGVFVVVHDATLDRETTGSGPVEGVTLAELKKLRKRYRDGSVSKGKAATLEELLLAGKGRILYKPDLKPGVVEHFDELARLITKLEMTDQVFIRTGRRDADTIEGCFENGTPRVEVMFKVETAAQVKAVAERFSPRTIQINVAKGESLSAEKREAIRAARDLGILVETHSYGDPAQWEDLIEAGVRMFHTAVPEKTLKFLRERGWRNDLEPGARHGPGPGR